MAKLGVILTQPIAGHNAGEHVGFAADYAEKLVAQGFAKWDERFGAKGGLRAHFRDENGELKPLVKAEAVPEASKVIDKRVK